MNIEYKKGIFLALSAYILWGILPIYWQFVDAIGAFEILAFRIIFSAIFMIFILAVGQKQRNAFQRDMNQLLGKPIQLLAIVVAGYVITLNWGTFIWAVTNGHVLQTSLGYYINPLVSILLALIFLKERFNKFEWLAILFAFIGVLYMTLKIGEFPIVSIILALSFGTYGLLKKVVHIDAISSITIECIVTAPAGLIYVIYLFMAATSDVIWIEHVIILVVIFWCYYGNTTNPILSRGKTYSTFANRIYSIRWTNNNVCTRHICFQRAF